MKKFKSICIIPARGGSKRIPRKNIKELNGKPLVAYTIEAAVKSECFDTVIVSSDDDEILEIAGKFGATPLKRIESLSGDSATVFQVFHSLLNSDGIKDQYDIIAGMLPTSPFRNADQVKEAYEFFVDQNKEASMVSVSAYDSPIQFGFEMEDESKLLTMLEPDAFNGPTQSQRLPKRYFNNGAIWMAWVSTYLNNKTFYKDPMVAFEMEGLSSFEIAEVLAKKINNNEL